MDPAGSASVASLYPRPQPIGHACLLRDGGVARRLISSAWQKVGVGAVGDACDSGDDCNGIARRTDSAPRDPGVRLARVRPTINVWRRQTTPEPSSMPPKGISTPFSSPTVSTTEIPSRASCARSRSVTPA